MDPDIENIINEVRLLFNALVQRGEALHADRTITISQRAVLEYLLKQGASTVPQIARRRRVSRQHIQALVNPLLDAGLVEKGDNPDHKRSPMIQLTGAGETTIRDMRETESKYLDQTGVTLPKRRLRETSETLKAIRAAIEH